MSNSKYILPDVPTTGNEIPFKDVPVRRRFMWGPYLTVKMNERWCIRIYPWDEIGGLHKVPNDEMVNLLPAHPNDMKPVFNIGS